ncbi:MAG: lasso peptide biosynthesis B2 protein [Bacteroidales bacterium]|nr:lasso peptide biosynthesis B2 protein [Bacteroidales bacterium]
MLSKLIIKGFPLKRLQWLIGRPIKEQNNKLHPSDNELQKKRAWKAGRAIDKISKRVLWKSVCLDQAVAASIVLSLLKIPFRFHLGLKKQENLKAHAWVSYGELIVTGRHHKDSYNEIIVFEK